MATKEIGSLRTRLSFEDEGALRSLEAFRRDLKGLRSEMNLVRSKGREYTQSLKGMREQSDILSRRLKVQQERVQELKKRYDDAVKVKGEDAEQTKNLAAQYNNAVAEMNRTEQQLEKLNAEIRRLESPWTKLGERMTSTGEKMQKFGRAMTDFGKSYTMHVTAPIVAGGTAVFKAAMDYESAFAGVRKTVDATEEEFQKLSAGIRAMAKEMPASAVEIAGVAEAAGQLGIKTENILSFTKTMINLGEATNLSAGEAATSLARFANIVGMSQKDFDRLGSSVVALGNNFATTEAEIVAMGLRLAGVGNQIGMTEAQIMALATAMSSVGIEAEAGGTAMSTVLKKMQNAVSDGGKALNNFAKAANMSSKEFADAFRKDPVVALDAFIKGLAKSSAEGKNLNEILADVGIKGIRESDTILRLAGASEILSEAVNLSTKAWKENTALTNEAEQRYATTESRLKIMWNRVKDVAISLGGALAPAIMDAIDAAEPLIRKIESGAKAFSEMDKEQQRTILKFIALAAAVGPASVVMGNLTTAIGGVLKVGGSLANMLGKAEAKAGTGGTGLLGKFAMLGPGSFTPVGLAIAGVGLLGLSIYKHIERSKEAKRVNLELAESLTEQANTLEKNIDRFEELQSKSKLSNDEMARLVDIYKEIQETSDKKALEKLNKEYEALLNKSGLTNDEFNEFVTLNDELVQKVDASNKKITDQGNALLDNTEKLKELSEAQRERIRLELDHQKAAAEANLTENLRRQKELMKEINELNEKIPKTKEKIAEKEANIAQLIEKYKKASQENNVIEMAYLADKIRRESKNLQILKEQLDTQTEKRLKKFDEIQAINDEIAKLNDAYQKMIELEMAQVGLNAEKGKELELINQTIAKLTEEKKQLEEKKKKHGDANGEIQKGIDKIDKQIEALNQAKDNVQKIKDEQEKTNEKIGKGVDKAKDMNKELGKDVKKNVKVDDNGTADKVHKKAEKPAKKNVKADDKGSVKKIDEKAKKPATKQVTLKAVWTGVKEGFKLALKGLIPGFATGTNQAPAGLAWLGEKGPELVRYKDKWALADFGLYNLRGGEQVFTHDQTMRIIRALNRIPGYANGTNMAAETNRIVNQLNDRNRTIINNENNIVINATIRDDSDIDKLTTKLDEKLSELGNRRQAAWGGA